LPNWKSGPIKLCVDKCTNYYGDDGKGNCVNCGSLTPAKIGYNNICNTSITIPAEKVDVTFNYYVKCRKIFPPKLSLGLTCVTTFPANYATELGFYICLDWKAENKFYYGGYVVSSCPAYNVPDIDSKCINCRDYDLFNYNDSCVTKCPDGYLTDIINNYCYNCETKNKLFYQGSCIDACPSNCYTDITAYKCVNCRETGKFMINGDNKCITICPSSSSIYESQNICSLTKCKDLSMVSFNNKCVDVCPTYTSFNTNTNSCETFFGKLLILTFSYDIFCKLYPESLFKWWNLYSGCKLKLFMYLQ